MADTTKKRTTTTKKSPAAKTTAATSATATVAAVYKPSPTASKSETSNFRPTPVHGPAPTRGISQEERHRMIQEAAFYRAERRGFVGDASDDWASAEAEIDSMLSSKRIKVIG